MNSLSCSPALHSFLIGAGNVDISCPRFTQVDGQLVGYGVETGFCPPDRSSACGQKPFLCHRDDGTRGNLRLYRSRSGCCPASAVTHGNQGNQGECKGSLQLHIHRGGEFSPCRTVIHLFIHSLLEKKTQTFLCGHVLRWREKHLGVAETCHSAGRVSDDRVIDI